MTNVGSIRVESYNGGFVFDQTTNIQGLNDGKWHHFVWTRNGTSNLVLEPAGAVTLRVALADFQDVLELGSQEFANATIADVSGVQGIAANSFNFVNVSLATTGPATLVKPLPTTRTAIRLGANDGAASVLTINAAESHGTDGLVLFQGGSTTHANMETRFVKYLSDNNVERFNAYGATCRIKT